MLQPRATQSSSYFHFCLFSTIRKQSGMIDRNLTYGASRVLYRFPFSNDLWNLETLDTCVKRQYWSCTLEHSRQTITLAWKTAGFNGCLTKVKQRRDPDEHELLFSFSINKSFITWGDEKLRNNVPTCVPKIRWRSRDQVYLRVNSFLCNEKKTDALWLTTWNSAPDVVWLRIEAKV